ncbi:AhpC/TSA family protein [Bacteroides sp. 214]|uniref:TlpA disulfide reductase family protein n=1 Tax=Bacteroides sp. 214 TaxID=2302935 RepID=UPI0013D577A9|nr:TlpA disulfide reductase family protein [Bacteroides sp. 214]NDW13543.1 AhpC/TSA family protein [Bacteroides sp. 214]
MKNICFILTIALCLLGCGEKDTLQTVKIQGEIAGLKNDTIYLYGQYENTFAILDTIYVHDNKFVHTVAVDTTTLSSLLFAGNEYPLFLEKGSNIRIKGDLTSPDSINISGSKYNQELTVFNNTVASLAEPTDSIIESCIESFIRQNQKSPVCLYLLDRYLVQKATPKMDKIKDFISYMDGELQDMIFTKKLLEKINENEKMEIGKMAPSFSVPDSTGKKISRYDLRNKVLLVNFWASWSDSCQASNAELRAIYKQYKKNEGFAILSISLDTDRESWITAIKNDTLSWQQLCDFSSWNSTVVKQYTILEVPENVLINNTGRIVARGIKGEELKTKLDELLKKDKN